MRGRHGAAAGPAPVGGERGRLSRGAGTGGAAATASTGQIPQATAMVEQPTTAATEPTAGTAAEPTAGTAAEPTAATAEQPTAQSAAGGGLLDVVKQRGNSIGALAIVTRDVPLSWTATALSEISY